MIGRILLALGIAVAVATGALLAFDALYATGAVGFPSLTGIAVGLWGYLVLPALAGLVSFAFVLLLVREP